MEQAVVSSCVGGVYPDGGVVSPVDGGDLGSVKAVHAERLDRDEDRTTEVHVLQNTLSGGTHTHSLISATHSSHILFCAVTSIHSIQIGIRLSLFLKACRNMCTVYLSSLICYLGAC